MINTQLNNHSLKELPLFKKNKSYFEAEITVLKRIVNKIGNESSAEHLAENIYAYIDENINGLTIATDGDEFASLWEFWILMKKSFQYSIFNGAYNQFSINQAKSYVDIRLNAFLYEINDIFAEPHIAAKASFQFPDRPNKTKIYSLVDISPIGTSNKIFKVTQKPKSAKDKFPDIYTIYQNGKIYVAEREN